MSKISVIVTTYNYAKYLPKCLKSILSQTRKPDEIIVVDDCSTDNTVEIIKHYGQKVQYLRHKRNWGNVCKTFNQGIKRAKGDYILTISADDWLRNDMLEREAAILDANPKVGLVYAQTITVKGNQKERIIHDPAGKTSYIGRGKDFELLLTSGGNFIPAPTVLVRKSVYEKLGLFNPNLPQTADWEMWIRVARHYSLAYIAEPLAYYRIHGANIHLIKQYPQNRWREEFRSVLEKHLSNDSPYVSQSLKNLAFYHYFMTLAAQEALETSLLGLKDFWLKAVQLKPHYLLKWQTWLPFYLFVRELLRAKKAGWIVFLLFICILTLITRWQSFSLPLDRDEGVYSYIASHLAEPNFMPYRDVFDHKPPVIYFLYWFSFIIFGKTQFAIRILGFANSAIAAIIFYLILSELKLTKWTKLVFLVGLIFISNSFVLTGLLTNTEVFLSTILTASLFIILKILNSKKADEKFLLTFCLGLTFAVSIFTKPNAIVNINLLILWLILLAPQRAKVILKVFAGFLVFVSLVILWLLQGGAFDKFWQSVITFNKWYVGNGIVDTIANLGFSWIIRAPLIVQILLPVAIVVLLLERKKLKKEAILMFLWLIAFFVGAKIPIRDFDHYYFPLLPASILFFAVTARQTVSKFLVFSVFIIFFSIWGKLLVIPPKDAYTAYYNFPYVSSLYEFKNLAFQIKNRTLPDNKVFLWLDEPQILFYSQRKATSRFINTYGMMIPSFYSELEQSLRERPSVVISFKDKTPDWIYNVLEKNSYTRDDSYHFATVYWAN